MKAIILAGGLGTRLRERVPSLPKPMAPVAGRPFLEYVLDGLLNVEIDEIILSVGYRANVIQEHFGNTFKKIPIRYAIESEPLGTGGAILNALEELNNNPVLVLNGDTILNLDYRNLLEWYQESPELIALVLRYVPDVERYGSVEVSGERVTKFVSKGKIGSGLINGGIYILKPELFKLLNLSGKFSFETDLLHPYCTKLFPKAFISDAYFIDIGIPEDYDRAQHELPLIRD